jgi:hypothetical protein
VSIIKSDRKCKTYVTNIDAFNDNVFSELGLSLPNCLRNFAPLSEQSSQNIEIFLL